MMYMNYSIKVKPFCQDMSDCMQIWGNEDWWWCVTGWYVGVCGEGGWGVFQFSVQRLSGKFASARKT